MLPICLRPCLRDLQYYNFKNWRLIYTNMAANVAHATHSDDTGDLSIRAQRKKKAHQHYLKKHKYGKALSENRDILETEYYFENGLRKVYPYYFNFNSYVKGRWINRTILDVYLTEFHGTSEKSLRDEIDRGRIMVNGKKVPTDFKLKESHFIEHVVHRHENPVIGGPIEIIANTPDLVVVNKPASIPCHPCSRYRYNSVIFILGVEYGLKNLRTLYRLDRLTSGVLVLPKTMKKSQKWEKQLQNKEFYKEYVCRVDGEFPEEPITCNEPIEVLSQHVTVFKVGPKGKPSTTQFTRLSFNGKSSTVKCVPLTGRSHQIRIHLQYLGHPILNDPIYNRTIYGKNKGKDGVIENSVPEIVEDIKRGSNIGRWKLGKNPKYALFLEKQIAENEKAVSTKDTKTVADSSGNQTNELGTPSDKIEMVINKPSTNIDDEVILEKSDSVVGANEKVDPINNEQALLSDGHCDSKHAIEVDSVDEGKNVQVTKESNDSIEAEELPYKRMKMDTECNENTGDSDKLAKTKDLARTVDSSNLDELHKQTTTTNSDVDVKSNSIGATSDDVNSADKVQPKEKNVVENTLESVTEIKDHLEAMTDPKDVCNMNDVTLLKLQNVDHFKSCDENKMTYEENCEECMYMYKDPLPPDCVLYLHAVRYKGPDWEYSVPLPDWADPDWTENCST